MKEVEVSKHFVTLQIWDTAGLLLSSFFGLFLTSQKDSDHHTMIQTGTERFSAIGNQYFRGADGCILVYDGLR